ncbi:hypothetical protein DXI23_20280 [Marinobacter flavimaris]|uniref:Type II toxin-antitoxin system HipA family toxin n=1 Tax=Marinobacter flavimaris TaxID=262076 RepID=A0A3D8GX95_9GAMM|nr:HipA domain-containing protein [Marinobacter flavimaris]PPI78444.1 hypothetical protein MDHKLMBL_20055 [Marinobacter flavimaris]RDU39067.1 hypothetical protein DXI23_20280 [Marinobacter flavimaris]
MRLTVQAFWGDKWHDAGTLEILKPDKGLLGPCRFSYSAHYVADAWDYKNDGEGFIDERAVSVNIPGSFSDTFSSDAVNAFVRDMIPQGFGRDALLRNHRIDRVSHHTDCELLSRFCSHPVGNLRIKEAHEAFQDHLASCTSSLIRNGISTEEAHERGVSIIRELAQEGVPVSGALGAGGDAPKMLLSERKDGRLFPEGVLTDDEIKEHWLVKFPRGKSLRSDKDILIAECSFSWALGTLGEDVSDGILVSSDGKPSFWIQRFDRGTRSGRVTRAGVESLYSLSEVYKSGERLWHEDVIAKLFSVTDHEDLIIEYLVRDAINCAIGNIDNHGRNSALIKRNGKIALSPAYDLAPMVLDNEGVIEGTSWRDKKLFMFRYQKIAHKLGARLEGLHEFQFLSNIIALPDSVIRHPRVSMRF